LQQILQSLLQTMFSSAPQKTAGVNRKPNVTRTPLTTFLGVLIEDPTQLNANRAHRSDVFYEYLVHSSGLSKLVVRLLPGRKIVSSFGAVTHHDEREAIVCALTALCIECGHYTIVGDQEDGWIVLPPQSEIKGWAWRILEENTILGGLDVCAHGL
jgi:hypothetical protein